MKLVLLVAFVGTAHLLGMTLSLRIGAFNIQRFGDKKLSNRTIASFIVRIVSTYDIALIQEVRDADLSAVKKLMSQLNEFSPNPFSYVVSQPLGRSSYKEQYLFIYREDMVLLLDSYHYDDGCEPCGEDTFSREPFIVKFYAPETDIQELILVPLHAPPKEAVEEIDALYDVYLDVKEKWGNDEMMFLGDFNADCSYVGPDDWINVRLRTEHPFHWLIEDTVDTTVGSTDCAYDRIVVTGAGLMDAIVPGSAHVDNFQKNFKLSSKDALAISDHFPIEVTLRSYYHLPFIHTLP